MELLFLYGVLAFLSAVSGRVVDVLPKPLGRKLFLSRNVVTEAGVFDGGVLVSEKGIIEAVLGRDVVNSYLAQSPHDLQIIDGGELALMAGVVDSHVHVNEPGRTSWEGYVSATQAAAVGGITTIIDMPLNSIPPTTTLDNLRTKAAMAKEEVFVDVGFWGGVIPGNEIELHDLIRAGVVGFKCFLTDSGVQEFPNVTPSELPKIFEVLNGTGTVLAFHAEVSLNKTDTECTTDCPNPLLYDTYLATHPEEMELKAVSLVTSLLPQTDVHVHIVHVSAAGVVPILEAARAQRLQSGYTGWRGGVTAETCHHYLTLSSEQIPPGHSEYKCSPPVRNNTNKQKLWEYIKDGRLDLVASDHSPSVEELKGTDFLKAWGGISSVQFDLSLFWTEAKARGYGLSTVTHYLSAGPARLAGLQDRKGSIRPGLDADLILFDPNASFIVTPEVIRYKNKISPYMNRVLTGVVERTYVRGQLVYADGELIGQPKGHLLLNDEMVETLTARKEEVSQTGRKNETNTLIPNDRAGDLTRNTSQEVNVEHNTTITSSNSTSETIKSEVHRSDKRVKNENSTTIENLTPNATEKHATTEAPVDERVTINLPEIKEDYVKPAVLSNLTSETTRNNLDRTEYGNKNSSSIDHLPAPSAEHQVSTTTRQPVIEQATTNINNSIMTKNTINVTAHAHNALTTTESPHGIRSANKWVMNHASNFSHNVCIVFAVTLVTILCK